MNLWLFLIFLTVSLIIYKILNTLSFTNLTELHTCPFCYGNDYCSEFEHNITLRYNSLMDVIFNLISIKNVYFAMNNQENIVIKKLADKNEFLEINRQIYNEKITINNLQKILINEESTKKFHVCDEAAFKLLFEKFTNRNFMNLWTVFNVNAEPILLEIFKKQQNWPVPKFFGYCGRVAVMENAGTPLNNIKNFNWYDRAYVALQILSAAEKFTFDHDEFRLYLTDISPDNIVVNSTNLKISFVDLENGILQQKKIGTLYHYSEHVNNDEYGFSSKEICDSHISDHNIYSVCRLLLSPFSPWPMMENGLLHSPPSRLNTNKLFDFIKICIHSENKTSRFLCSKNIKNILNDMLVEAKYFNIHKTLT